MNVNHLVVGLLQTTVVLSKETINGMTQNCLANVVWPSSLFCSLDLFVAVSTASCGKELELLSLGNKKPAESRFFGTGCGGRI